jgi:hypothetical protein
VCGVDFVEHPGVAERLDSFVQANLDDGLPSEAGAGYDVVIAAEVLENVRRPETILAGAKDRLGTSGVIMASVHNFGHWYPRLRTVVGRFGYDDRGILDRERIRFFTQRSFHQLLSRTNLSIRRRSVTAPPLDVVTGQRGRPWDVLDAADRTASWMWPQLFAYEFLFELTPAERKHEGS